MQICYWKRHSVRILKLESPILSHWCWNHLSLVTCNLIVYEAKVKHSLSSLVCWFYFSAAELTFERKVDLKHWHVSSLVWHFLMDHGKGTTNLYSPSHFFWTWTLIQSWRTMGSVVKQEWIFWIYVLLEILLFLLSPSIPVSMFDVWAQAFMTCLSDFVKHWLADYEILIWQAQEGLMEVLIIKTLEYWTYEKIHELFTQSHLSLIVKVYAQFLAKFVSALLLSLLFR